MPFGDRYFEQLPNKGTLLGGSRGLGKQVWTVDNWSHYVFPGYKSTYEGPPTP